jgi:hypothetical protein
MRPSQRPYGARFLFGQKLEELRMRSVASSFIGNIDPEWDQLVEAELEVRQPTTSHTDGHGPVS